MKAILFGSGAAVVVVGLGKFLQVRHHQKETAAD